jgi:tetratricopeptide (TPR) repeat protein
MKPLLKSRLVIIAIAIVLLIFVGIITTVTVAGNNRFNVQKQLSLGEKYLNELEYEKAVVVFNKIIDVEPRNMQAYLGLAEAYVGLKQPEKAIEALEAAVTKIKEAKEDTGEILDNSEDIFIKLADLYEENGEAEKAYNILKEGYDLIGSDQIANLLKKYRPTVEVSVPSGSYEAVQRVTLISEGSQIFYTLDGSDPTELSDTYNSPIEIGEGTTTLKAVSVNEFGEFGEIKEFSYTVNEAEEDDVTGESEATAMISIAKVSPSKVTVGKETTFTVTVNYTSTNANACIIYAGANIDESDSYSLLDEFVLPDTSGEYTFTFTCTPVEWADNPFGLYVNISDYPHSDEWTPLASDRYNLDTE